MSTNKNKRHNNVIFILNNFRLKHQNLRILNRQKELKKNSYSITQNYVKFRQN